MRAYTEENEKMKKETGKGGNFKSEKNPFRSQTNGKGPLLQKCPGILTAIDIALGSGCAIIIGKTRDGGAISLTILDGDDRHRTYCATDAELGEAALAIRDTYRTPTEIVPSQA